MGAVAKSAVIVGLLLVVGEATAKTGSQSKRVQKDWPVGTIVESPDGVIYEVTEHIPHLNRQTRKPEPDDLILLMRMYSETAGIMVTYAMLRDWKKWEHWATS